MTTVPNVDPEAAPSRFGEQRVERDAVSTAVSSLVNSGLGAAFWLFSAKFIPAAELGVMTAFLAVILAGSAIVATGVGDAYTALLPAVGSARTRVFRRGQRVFFAMAAAVAVIGAIASTTLLQEVRGSVGVAVLVIIGILGWSTFTLQNPTLIALGRARWLPAVNTVLGVSKIVLLPILAFTISWHSVELAVVISAVAIVAVCQPKINRIISSGNELSETATISESTAVGEFNRLVIRTVALSALGLGLLMLTPFLVTVFSDPRQGALFSLALSFVAALDFIGASMAVSLVVHASSAPEHAGKMARSLLLRAGVITTVGSACVIAVVPVLLGILNPEYKEMGPLAVIVVMCAATVTRVPYLVWAAFQQSRRTLRMPLIFNVVTAILMFAIMPGLCGAYGALGGAWALFIHQAALTVAAGVHFLFERRAGKRQ